MTQLRDLIVRYCRFDPKPAALTPAPLPTLGEGNARATSRASSPAGATPLPASGRGRGRGLSALGTYALLLIFPLLLSTQLLADVTTDKTDYHSWKDSWKLTNGKTSVVVVPQIGGRIMEFSLNGESPIWINPAEFGKTYPAAKAWRNFGGYKTWNAPQTAWGWPPDPYLDYAPAKVENTGVCSLKITGSESKTAGVKFIKELVIDPENRELGLLQKMKNTSEKEVEWGVWDVTQVKTPCRIAFPVNPKSKFPDGVVQLHTDPKSGGKKQWKVRDGICILNYQGITEKIGADPDTGWMLWTSGKLAYIKLFPVSKIEANYQDNGCQVEVFVSSGPPSYIEMEVSSPIVKLKPGAETSLAEVWRLVPLDKPVENDDDLFALIDTLKAQGLLK